MQPLQLALLTLLFGLVVGAGMVILVVVSQRIRDRARADSAGAVPPGAAAVVEALEDPAAVVDASFTVVAASLPALSLGLVTGDAVVGTELRELLRTVRDGAAPVQATLRLQRGGLSDEEILVTARASRLTPRHLLLIARDITEQERLAQMRRDFVANTSHELKTPVGAVTLLSEAIQTAADDPPQVRIFAGRLQAEAERLAELTARILNLSRLQAADDPMLVSEVSVDEVVASAVDAHVTMAHSAGVEVIRGGDRGLFVRGDTSILVEAIGNLLSNAIAYSPTGSKVGVGVRLVGEVVEIAVTDQGIGIHEADQARVFERFYRSDQARSRRTGGSGLGLSIVKHAVQRHGGEVRLWSRPGRGATFTVRLPAIEPPGGWDAAGTRKKPKKKKKKKKNAARSVVAPANGDNT